MLRLLCITLALTTAFASPVAHNDCTSVLQSVGATERFPGVVAHGVHSITVEQLQQFKPDVTEKNIVPTINMDLSDGQAILPHALYGPKADKVFKTEAMRTVDQVLSHMDNSKYDIKQYSALERLVHALHMKEVWNSVHPHYENMEKSPPAAEVCQCARDIENNGVMKMLRFIALEIREPALMYGKHITLNNGTVSWSGNVYNYGNFVRTTPDAVLRSANETMPQLTNEAAWGFWKTTMKTMQPNDDFELALYLYCALNA